MEELVQLKQRMDQFEEELKKIRDEGRIGTIEYHIESLRVESIQNGILDLGVHMGNEMDKRIQTSGAQQAGEEKKQQQAEEMLQMDSRIQDLERNMLEVKDQIQSWEERFQTIEKQIKTVEQRVRNLEVLHW